MLLDRRLRPLCGDSPAPKSGGRPLVFVPIVANAAYSTRLIPGLPRLKDIPVMKNVTVAVSWAVVCTLIPGMQMEPTKIGLIAIIMYFMMVRDFTATVLYDIRDVEGDRRSAVRTLPVILGPSYTSKILFILNSTLLPLLPFVAGETKLLIKGLPSTDIFASGTSAPEKIR